MGARKKEKLKSKTFTSSKHSHKKDIKQKIAPQSKSRFKKHNQDHEPKRIVFVAGLVFVLLIFLSGCGEMSRSEKNLCYSLASRSYDYVPACETEESCFGKVDELFHTTLGNEQEGLLYEIKNSAARSWFFYNKAVTEMKKLSSLCASGNSGDLPGTINQARFYLDKAFLELDASIKKSFELIKAEETLLSKEKIDLIKEEPLFDSLTELRQVLSELNSGKTNSGSYVSFYLEKVSAFNASSLNRSYPTLIENTPFWLKGYDYFQGALLASLGLENEFFFPFLEPGLNAAFSIAEQKFYANEGLAALQQFPAAEFMMLYSNLGGNKNSAFMQFTVLANNLSERLGKIKDSSADLWKTVELKQSSCSALAENTNSYSKYEELAKELLSGKIVAQKDQKELLDSYSKRFLELRTLKSQGLLSLGEELLFLKDLKNKFDALENELSYENEKQNDLLIAACDKKGSEENTFLQSEAADAHGNAGLAKLESEVAFFAAKTLSSNGEEKLNYCTELLQKAKDLKLGIADYKKLEFMKTTNTKNCFAYLEKVLQYADNVELQELFAQLKNTKVTQENLLYFEDACNSILKQAENELSDDAEIIELQTAFAKLVQVKDELASIAARSQNKEIENDAENAHSKAQGFEPYFLQGKINFVEVLPIKKQLLASINKSLAELTAILQKDLLIYVKDNAEITSISSSIPTTNQEFSSTTRILLSNPFSEVPNQAKIVLPKLNGTVNSKDTWVESITFGNETIIAFSKLPHGISKIELLSNDRVETAEIIKGTVVSNEESLFEKKISLLTEKIFPRIIIETQILPGTGKSVVFVEQKEAFTAQHGSKISFAAENADKKTTISAFFYVYGAISVETQLLNSKQIDLTQTKLNYSVTASSNIDQEIDAALIINLPTNSFVENIKVFDEEMTRKLHEVVEGKIVLKNQHFLPKQQKHYSITIEISSIFDYYIEALKKAHGGLLLLNENEISAEIKKFLELDFDGNLAEKADALLKKANAKILLLNAQQESERAFFLQKDLLDKKIKELEEKTKTLRDLNLLEEAEYLSSVATKAKQFLAEGTKDSIAKGYDLLNKAAIEINSQIKKEADALEKKLIDKAKNNSDPKLDLIKGRFLKEKALFDEQSAIDPFQAGQTFMKLKETFSEFEKERALLDENAKNNSAELLKSVNLLSTQCFDAISLLERELSFDEKDLLVAKIVPPITIQRLKELKLQLSELTASDLSAKDKKAKLVEIKNELQGAIDSIKRQAISSYNKAIDIPVDSGTLTKAKSFLDNNKYMSALLLLSQSGSNNSSPQAFLAFIPIILIICVALFLKKRIGKKEKAVLSQRTEVLNGWND